jgi:hypothetical protein
LKRALTIEFDDFGWSRIREEAERQGTSPEEVVSHAVAYYMADLDSGRIAARVLKEVEESDDEADPGKSRRHFRRDADEPRT